MQISVEVLSPDGYHLEEHPAYGLCGSVAMAVAIGKSAIADNGVGSVHIEIILNKGDDR